MKLTMGTSGIGYNFLRMNSEFTQVMFISLNSDIYLKLKNGLDRLTNWSNLYPQRVIGTLDVKEFRIGIMKLGLKMEQPSSIVISVIEGLTVLLSV